MDNLTNRRIFRYVVGIEAFMRFIALSVVLFLSGCQESSAPTPRVPTPSVGAFSVRSPTATEVFNLRSKCAELGEKIVKNTVVSDVLQKEQVPHYEPKTNRCYVQLTIWNANLTNGGENFEESLLDGQTGQVLAKIRRENGKKSGIIYVDPSPLNGNSDELYLDASTFIREMMEDDRLQ
jgi:hypothetical protein